jgi:hypothetical protein
VLGRRSSSRSYGLCLRSMSVGPQPEAALPVMPGPAVGLAGASLCACRTAAVPGGQKPDHTSAHRVLRWLNIER